LLGKGVHVQRGRAEGRGQEGSGGRCHKGPTGCLR
jgi:hypothetical protein